MSCVLCVCSPPQASFYHLLSPFYPLLAPSTPFPSDNHHTIVYDYEHFFCLISSLFSPRSPKPLLNSYQSVLCVYESISILFVCLFCSLDSTYEIIWYLYFSNWFISLGIILSRPIHAVTKGKISLFFMAK